MDYTNSYGAKNLVILRYNDFKVRLMGIDVNTMNDDSRVKELEARCIVLENELSDLRIELDRTAAIRKERDLLQVVLNLIPDSIFVKNKYKKFIFSNKQHFTSLGCSSLSGIIGKSDRDFFDESLADEFEEGDEQIICSGESVVVREEEGVEPTTGEKNYILVSKALLGDEYGGGLVGIARNITQLKESICSAEKSKSHAEHANNAKNQFLAKMSHEVRTPLNGIICVSRLLMHVETDKSKVKELSIIYESAGALLAIISDMLDLTAIESGRAKSNDKVFSLNAIVNESIKFIFIEGSNDYLRVKSYIDSDVPDSLFGDSERLRQVLINLLSNARKFTEQGEIYLCVRQLQSNDGLAHLEFTLDDDGVGVGLIDKGVIFESFNQEDNSLIREYSGTGLGLAICKNIVTYMNGNIKVESPSPRSGKGSRFTFDVFIKVDRVNEPNKDFELLDVNYYIVELKKVAENGKVLLVEDNPVNQKITLALLAKAGIYADVVENGQLAVDAVFNKDYTTVLMDLQMPIMDGLTATRKIRDSEKGKYLPIVALTAQVLENDHQDCLNAGMNGYIPKPINIDLFYALLHKYLCGQCV